MVRSPTRSRPARKALRAARPTPWIGRLADDSRSWVLAWAPTRTRAQRMIEDDVGAIDPASLKPLEGAGYFLFQSAPESAGPDIVPAPGECLILYDRAAEEWISGAGT